MDPYEFLQISRNPDGSITRRNLVPSTPPTGDHPTGDHPPVLSKDLSLNPSRKTWLRLFLPSSSTSSSSKLPIVLFFHGGGFIILSPESSVNHVFCEGLAESIPAVVVSASYRLAPEHRLPAAYDDAEEALLWLAEQARGDPGADPWLALHADFSRCFVAGSSAGGNIALHAALRARELRLGTLRLSGVLLHQPFFGGKRRTESEVKFGGEGAMFQLSATDLMWELSLPEGADRDHEYSNPMAAEEQGKWKWLPRCLVTGFGGDLLVDRQREVAEMLGKGGVEVLVRIEEEGIHGSEISDEGKAKKLFSVTRNFVNSGEGGP